MEYELSYLRCQKPLVSISDVIVGSNVSIIQMIVMDIAFKLHSFKTKH